MCTIPGIVVKNHSDLKMTVKALHMPQKPEGFYVHVKMVGPANAVEPWNSGTINPFKTSSLLVVVELMHLLHGH